MLRGSRPHYSLTQRPFPNASISISDSSKRDALHVYLRSLSSVLFVKDTSKLLYKAGPVWLSGPL